MMEIREYTGPSTEDLIEDNVVRLDPGDKSKRTERREYVRWNPDPTKHAAEDNEKVFETTDPPSGDFAWVLISEQGMKQSGVDESRGPHHCCWPD
jgi:hypothetical protein